MSNSLGIFSLCDPERGNIDFEAINLREFHL
jgi:hypothetical protein